VISTVQAPDRHSAWRFVILALAALTPFSIVPLPNLSLPPMFTLISEELSLSLVQVGAVRGMIGFSGVFFALVGGSIADRLGARRTLFIICLLSGLFGMLRSLATDFNGLLLTTLLYGCAQGCVPVIVFKAIRQRFPRENLGMASGVVSAGFATGLMLGPLLSTSVLLPALGGCRQALLLYGLLAIIVRLLWLLLHPAGPPATPGAAVLSLGWGLHAARCLRGLWGLGIGGRGVGAGFGGFTGYLPTYLKAGGWAPLDADRSLSVFFVTSLLCVVPLSTLSDRLRSRRGFLVALSLVLGVGVGALGLVTGARVLLVAALTGTVFDALMALQQTSVMEVDGVDDNLSGSALGMVTTVRNVGLALAPPLGNSLAVHGAGLPFLYWGACGIFAALMFGLALRLPAIAPRRA